MKIINLVGKKFGKLTVIEMSNERSNSGQIKWNTICDCGNNHTVTGDSLRGKKSKSCGCLLKNFVPKNKNPNRKEAIIKRLYYKNIIQESKNNERIYDISLEDFENLILAPCFYCGITGYNKIEDKFNQKNKEKNHLSSNIILFCNGIDRINSDIGYIKSNVVTCCKRCNYAKNSMSINEFYKLIKLIYEHSKEKINQLST